MVRSSDSVSYLKLMICIFIERVSSKKLICKKVNRFKEKYLTSGRKFIVDHDFQKQDNGTYKILKSNH